MSAVLDYILNTNLFNFIIFAGIITYLALKLDLVGTIAKGSESVAQTVEDSETTKTKSEEHLSAIENSVAHLQEEVEEIISKSIDNANLVGNQIMTDADNTVEGIKENTAKLVENRTALLRNDILKRASLASVEVAKNHIISELNNNYDLHLKLIDESIDAINKVEAD